MLNELSKQTQQAVGVLYNINQGEGNFPSIEARDTATDRIKYQICEEVITLLLKEAKPFTK